MKQNKCLRYCKAALLFLVGWFGFAIFGSAVWHFVVVNVEQWLPHGAILDTISGLVGAAVFVAGKEFNRSRKEAVAEDRRRQLAQFMERARSREQASQGAE
jgi:nitrogen fixation protein FixH